MSAASKLLERVIKRANERKMQIGARNPDGKYLHITETGKHNGTEENVTVTITGLHGNRIVMKIKVPKNASDKLIESRLDEAETFLNA